MRGRGAKREPKKTRPKRPVKNDSLMSVKRGLPEMRLAAAPPPMKKGEIAAMTSMRRARANSHAVYPSGNTDPATRAGTSATPRPLRTTYSRNGNAALITRLGVSERSTLAAEGCSPRGREIRIGGRHARDRHA